MAPRRRARKGASLAAVVLAWMCKGESESPSAATKAACGPRSRSAMRNSSHTAASPQSSERTRGAQSRSGHSSSVPPSSVRCSGPNWYASEKPRQRWGARAQSSAISTRTGPSP